MPKSKSEGERKNGDDAQRLERTDGRSSPGSGEEGTEPAYEEDDGDDAAADLQPDEVESGDTAR